MAGVKPRIRFRRDTGASRECGLQRWTVEGEHLRTCQAELAQGHQVVDVHIHGRRNQGTVAQSLRAHGPHFINACGRWDNRGLEA
jgi:hypothetical protein